MPQFRTLTASLLVTYLIASLISLALVGFRFRENSIIALTWDQSFAAAPAMLLMACFLPIFVFVEFGFGYIVGFYMYGMVTGFVLLSYSTTLPYDHSEARVSAILSLIAFLIPVLTIRRSIPSLSLTRERMDRLMIALLAISAMSLVLSASYGFRLANPLAAIHMRGEVTRPSVLNYLNGNITCAVLPFAFAYFIEQKRWKLATVSVLLVVLFFPILLNKTILFTPVWLVFLYLLFRTTRPRIATILSLLLPITIGASVFVIAWRLGSYHLATTFLGTINMRMIAIPSSALDHYYAFFSSHPSTNFCHISALKRVIECPYIDQLGVIFEREFKLGNFNGSLFATEGVAALGAKLAPLGTFVAGLVIALGNLASSRLPVSLIAVSSGIVIQSLMNVPLSTMLLSNGLLCLFFLWLMTPRPDQIK